MRSSWTRGALAAVAVGGVLAAPASAAQNRYQQTNLVSNVPGVAMVTDPNLVNAWGLSASPTSPIWVSDNGTDLSTLYRGGVGGVTVVPLVVSVPVAPTGTVFNGGTGFVVHDAAGDAAPAVFLFDTESGDILGWNPAVPPPPPSTQAQVAVHVDGAEFKGLTMSPDNTRLYAADFVGGHIDVYDQNWMPAAAPGSFTDKMLPAGYAPFNVQSIRNRIYVAYAKVGPTGDEVAGKGNGFVDVYSLGGKLTKRLVAGGRLNAPWGLAQAPSNWGAFSNAILVGNFGDGLIGAYDPGTGAFLGNVRDANHDLVRIDGLWALRFGNGTIGTPRSLLFSAGPNGESDGLFGEIDPIGG